MKVSYSLDFEGPDEAPRRFAIFATIDDPRLGPPFTIPDAIGWAAPKGKDGARGARRLKKCLKEAIA